MNPIGYAIDVSHHQHPASLPWKEFRGKVQAVIVRACYGAELRDMHAKEHVRRAREVGAKIGLYMFYRPHHPVVKQFDLFRSVGDSVLYGPGDVVPTVDVEKDPFAPVDPTNPTDVAEDAKKTGKGQNVSPKWAGPLEELVGKLDEHFGARTMTYITQREFGFLGKPAWVVDPKRPLWTAYYPRRSKYVPGMTPPSAGNRVPTMWQHRVDLWEHFGPGGVAEKKEDRRLDQNLILSALPLLGPQPAAWLPIVDTTGELDEGLEDYLTDNLMLTGEEIDAIAAGAINVGDIVRDGIRSMSEG